MNWQPIETAPKDGTEILVWGNPNGDRGDDKCRAVSAWFESDTFPYSSEGWRYCCFDGGYYGELCDPTHWMPLPEPPAENEKEPGN